MSEAFFVALSVFICVGGGELLGFTMLNRPIVIGPLVGLFLGDVQLWEQLLPFCLGREARWH